MKSHQLVLMLSVLGLVSSTACTAEKSEMKSQDVSVTPSSSTVPTAGLSREDNKKIVDGAFTSNEHLPPVYFGLGQSKISEEQMAQVKQNGAWLVSQPPYLIKILGYADSRGSTKKNERLAEHRAMALRDAYVALGVSKDRIMIASRGETEDSCKPMTEDCLAMSRRTETLVETKFLAEK